jgi:gliding motility-associated-like protein
VKINGVTLGSASVPIQNCAWGQISYIWNSGSNTTAEICLFDNVYEGIGNDFAIDDISLLSQNSCLENVTISMATQNPNYDVAFPENGCLNETNISPILGPNYISGGFYNAFPAGLNINPISGEISMQNSISGNYQITYSAQICGATVPDTFNFSLHSAPEFISLSGGDYNCQLQVFNPVLLNINGLADFSVYFHINDSIHFINSSQNPINLGNEIGQYVLDSISDNHCGNQITATLTISAADAPVIPYISGDSVICINSIINTLEVTNVSEGIKWYSNSSLTEYIGSNLSILPNNQSSATYYATQTVNGCEGLPGSFYVNVIPCNLIIPSAFTPNNDGDNDVWSIYGLDSQYPENIVRVYNRWGELLYESLPGTYTSKPWDGKYKEASLPVGSYYYVIDLSNGADQEPLNGIVSIILKK